MIATLSIETGEFQEEKHKKGWQAIQTYADRQTHKMWSDFLKVEIKIMDSLNVKAGRDLRALQTHPIALQKRKLRQSCVKPPAQEHMRVTHGNESTV